MTSLLKVHKKNFDDDVYGLDCVWPCLLFLVVRSEAGNCTSIMKLLGD